MSLSYPNGKLVGEYPRKSLVRRAAWFYIFIGGYAAQIIQNLYNLLFFDGRGCPYCVPAERSWLHIGKAPFSVDWWNRGWAIEIIVVLPIGLVVAWLRLVPLPPGARRTYLPIAIGGTIATFFAMAVLYFIVVADQAALVSVSSYSWIQTAGQLGAALAVFVGLGRRGAHAGPSGDLVVELDRASPGGVRGRSRARSATRASSSRCGCPSGGRGSTRRVARCACREPDRAVTFIGDDLAAIVHDPVFLDQPALLEAVGSAARFALENERLQAELRAQLPSCVSRARGSCARATRSAAVSSATSTTARSSGCSGSAWRCSCSGSNQGETSDASALLDETEDEVQAALAELRELARGIHPAVLTDHGLGAGASGRSPSGRRSRSRSARPTSGLRRGRDRRLLHRRRGARQRRASTPTRRKARVSVGRENGSFVSRSATTASGAPRSTVAAGLRGLADRAGALDGRSDVDSPRGGGTRVVVEIPCAS